MQSPSLLLLAVWLTGSPSGRHLGRCSACAGPWAAQAPPPPFFCHAMAFCFLLLACASAVFRHIQRCLPPPPSFFFFFPPIFSGLFWGCLLAPISPLLPLLMLGDYNAGLCNAVGRVLLLCLRSRRHCWCVHVGDVERRGEGANKRKIPNEARREQHEANNKHARAHVHTRARLKGVQLSLVGPGCSNNEHNKKGNKHSRRHAEPLARRCLGRNFCN